MAAVCSDERSTPDPDASAAYDALYEEYAVLHRLRQIRRDPNPADPRGDRSAL